MAGHHATIETVASAGKGRVIIGRWSEDTAVAIASPMTALIEVPQS
jgi:hypothetical protein